MTYIVEFEDLIMLRDTHETLLGVEGQGLDNVEVMFHNGKSLKLDREKFLRMMEAIYEKVEEMCRREDEADASLTVDL